MSLGAAFTLIANEGKCDRMIMATKLLNQRIQDVMIVRKKAGKADITPTLVDLERTHILYVNAHFKPFAAIGFEYNKVRPQSGNPTLGSGVTFSIPQFGDFFHDMVIRLRLSQFNGNTGLTPLQATGSGSAPSLFPFNGQNAAGGALTTTSYNIVDLQGNVLVAGVPVGTPNAAATYRNLVRYCEFPGLRAFTSIKFDVNGNPLDAYDTPVSMMLEKFCVAPNKRVGHNRLLGQEVPLEGVSGPKGWPVTDADPNTPKGVISRFTAGQSNQTVALYNLNAAGLSSALTVPVALDTLGAAQTDVSRVAKQILNGPQTPKPVQPPLELWHKVRFWYSDDVRLAIPSVSIPFGQRYLTVELGSQTLLTFEFPSIYLETIVEAGAPTRRTKTYTPIFQPFGMTSVSIEKLELYINNIFVNPEIHDIYIKRIGFSLIRVYRVHQATANAEGTDEKLLSQLKWPIEFMMAGIRPNWNTKDISGTGTSLTGNQNVYRDWHRLTRQVDVTSDNLMLSDTPTGAVPPTSPAAGSNIGQICPDRYWLPVPTVDTLTLTSHGITIYDGFQDLFYSQYLPYHYGGANITTPDDVGALFINMALFPRSYQPSGHLNISRARETYISYKSSYITSLTTGILFVVGVAINFLLVTDGSAVLRYST